MQYIHAPDAQALGQTREDAHDQLRRGALTVKERAMGFGEISMAGDALPLAPGLAARMPIRTDVAMSEPAVIGAIGSRTPMLRSVDGVPASSGAGEHRRGCARHFGW
jgi:hypothetical protein